MIRTWCVAALHSATFVAAMEGLLLLYARRYDPTHPVICFDECSKELRRHVRPPVRDHQGVRIDSEYARNGMAAIHVWVEPLTGRLGAQVTPQRRRREFAFAIRDLVAQYPDAAQITVVLDNLNTHRPGSLYQAFPPEEAAALLARLRFVHTPVHASWLNMAEIAISVLSRAVLKDQYVPTRVDLETAITAFVAEHNAHPTPITWTFTVDRARARMPHVYPIIDDDK